MRFDPAQLSPGHRTLGVEVLAAITRVLSSGASPQTAMTVITAIVDHFVSATEAKATAEGVRREMDRLLRAMASSDADVEISSAKPITDPE